MTQVTIAAALAVMLLAIACGGGDELPPYVLTEEEETWCAEIAAGALPTVEMEYASASADGEAGGGTQNVPIPLAMVRELIKDRIAETEYMLEFFEEYEPRDAEERAALEENREELKARALLYLAQQKALLDCLPLPEGVTPSPTPQSGR